MRRRTLAAALVAGLLVIGPVVSQQPGGRGGRGGGGFGGFGGGGLAMMIGNNKQLQDELKVNEDQAKKLTDALAKVREETQDDTAKLRDQNTSQEERDNIRKKIADANEKAVASVLKPEQVKRLHQIENQQANQRAPLGMFAKADVQLALKLNDDQKDKIKGITTDLQKDLRDLQPAAGGGGNGGRGGRGGFGGGFGAPPDPEMVKKQQGLRKEAMDSVVKLLNGEQKTTLEDLTGKPFELTFQNFGGGRGGFGGGGFGGFARPGTVMATGVQDQLKLSAEQKTKLADLQKDVDEKLAKILTEDQNKQLKEMQAGGGRGGRGGNGRGGRGGQGGKPQPDF